MVVVIIQARSTSNRLPRKVLKPLTPGNNVLEFMLNRVKRCEEIDQILVATTTNISDNAIELVSKKHGVNCFRGSETDVLGRFFEAGKALEATIVVRLTADCPFIDPVMIDSMLKKFRVERADYMYNQMPPAYPKGFDVEIFTFDLLRETHNNSKASLLREHVTTAMQTRNDIRKIGFPNERQLSHLRVTLDEIEDYEVILDVVNYLENRDNFSWIEVVEVLESHPEIVAKNSHLTKNNYASASASRKLWSRAQKLITNGGSSLQKIPNFSVPENWPIYYKRAKGKVVWDLDDKKLVDMSIMGLGANILGYANDRVDAAVNEAIQKSNVSSLMAADEVLLAERLLEIHPWFNEVKFVRSELEAHALSIRLSQRASGKSRVAICGSLGSSSWFSIKNLLEPSEIYNSKPGASTSYFDFFDYDNFEKMREILSSPDLGVVFIEPIGTSNLKKAFIEEIRLITERNGTVLIFDEHNSGFREVFGGLHKQLAVFPDIAVLGRALGNGYSISAILGRREVMEFSDFSFPSSLSWSDRIGFAAALASLDEMENLSASDITTHLGKYYKSILSEVFLDAGIEHEFSGLLSMVQMNIKHVDADALMSFLSQEMISRNQVLFTDKFFPSTCHNHEDIDNLGEQLSVVLQIAKPLIARNTLRQHLLGLRNGIE